MGRQKSDGLVIQVTHLTSAQTLVEPVQRPPVALLLAVGIWVGNTSERRQQKRFLLRNHREPDFVIKPFYF